MIYIFTLIAYILTIPLFIIWLLFCAFLAFLGLLLFKKQIVIDIQKVKDKETICSVLNKKALLSDEEYDFETNDVANLYDDLIFRGYLFVLAPIIFLLKYTNFANSFILYLVHKWMQMHKYKKVYKKEPKTFFSTLMNICVRIAGLIGQFLYRLKA